MKHLGDITKINGAEAPVVNVIIGGSPCQDLSLAGKRKGLAGERSGLFMEQIRIIKEMREADEARGRTDEHIRPRFMVWENVPGAFSSNKGADFGAVLHETVKIACHNAPPVPMFGNKWAKSGCLVDVDGKWSIAWRVFDAQFWGVPQRRRRIALVADFGGQSAPEILFERKSVSRNFEESGTAWKRAAADFEKRTEATVFGICSKDSNSMKSENPKSGFYEADVTRTLDCNGGNPSCNQGGTVVIQSRIDGGKARNYKDPKCITYQTVHVFDPAQITSKLHRNQMLAEAPCHTMHRLAPPAIVIRSSLSHALNTIDRPAVVQSVPLLDGGENVYSMATGEYMTVSKNQASTLLAGNYKRPQCVAYQCSWDGGQTSPTLTKSNVGGQQRMPDNNNFNAVIALDRASFNQGKNAQYDFEVSESGINSSLVARGPSAVCSKEKSERERYIVRRLTPLECERLQGFPDNWTNIGEWTDSKGKLHKESSDSARYKALGNSIALPSWFYVLSKLSEFCEEKTMASLFDGIGGFSLIWETLNGKGSCLWASEIEEFPIAVTKHHFPDEEKEKQGD